MERAILIYGATGFTGRLIAAEGAAPRPATAGAPTQTCRMILAGRDGPQLKELASKHGMEFRSFGLDDRQDIVKELSDVDVVINAAGPFALTAEPLAKAALEAGSHYVDINGEVDVYKRLDDLGRYAEQRDLAMVCSAGHSAAASDRLLNAALRELLKGKVREYDTLGSIRIAMSRVVNFSRGSAETLARSLKEQVTVVRKGVVADARGQARDELLLWHEPVGKFEHTFDFGASNRSSKSDLRIASAANLVDTLTARLTVLRNKLTVRSIESYVETGAASRIGYQLGALLAPMSALPWVRGLVRAPMRALPEGPTKAELDGEGHVVVLEIEDIYRRKIVDWRWETPNVYQLTAQLVVAVAELIATGKYKGWCTPAEVLSPDKPKEEERDGMLRGCRLDARIE